MPNTLANGINIYFETHGKERNPPLVLVGGLTRDHTIWNPVINDLVHDYYVIVYDNRGAGQTDKPQGPYTTEMLGDDLAALLDKINIKSAYIVGHSMGGFAAQHLAAKHPEKVAGLILCSTCAKQPNEGITYLTERLALIREEKTPLEQMIRSALPWLHTTEFLTEDKIQSIIKAAQSNPYPQPKLGLEAQIIACIKHDATAILSSIQVPTLVITGKEDKVMTPDVSRILKDQIKNSDFVIIDNSAHMVQTETPEALCQAIKDFTNKIEKKETMRCKL